MKIFVLHYSKLIDRKKHILAQFEKHNITDYEFIEKYDKEELAESEISRFVPTFTKSNISLSLKHMYAYKEISEKYDISLIFEDDVILDDFFTGRINNYISQLPKDCDMLFIGDGCNLHIENDKLIPNINIYKKCLYPTNWGGNGATRCTDSYIVTKKCAIQLCKYINTLQDKISHTIDWWVNVAARDNNFIVYWSEPTIVSQGSAGYGGRGAELFPTSLDRLPQIEHSPPQIAGQSLGCEIYDKSKMTL